ncbi:MAG: patatin-like phospholipase family protein [Candidatus Sumerlaeia bacterium]|nr:patatin-like phospholipase family protein [Candidatus Sumerlaeia bacterium]
MRTVLSIDGGGIRGIIPALVLAHLEKEVGKPACRMFDLMGGTSTGGIISLALARPGSMAGLPRYSASDVAKLYEQRGKDIFARSFWKGVSSAGGVTDEKYSHKGLEAVLEEYFEREPMGSALRDVFVTSYDIQQRTPTFIKSWKAEHRSMQMRHAARATSAAPTYFEPAGISVGGSVSALIDGGVFINSPALSAYAEARRRFPNEPEILVVSLGTGELTRPIPFEDAKGWGKAGWLLPLLSCMFDGVSDATHYQLSQLLPENRYYRFQIALDEASDDMDDASAGNIRNLRYEAEKLIEVEGKPLGRLIEALKMHDARDGEGG